jgi:hypothetical protein
MLHARLGRTEDALDALQTACICRLFDDYLTRLEVLSQMQHVYFIIHNGHFSPYQSQKINQIQVDFDGLKIKKTDEIALPEPKIIQIRISCILQFCGLKLLISKPKFREMQRTYLF